MFKRLALLDIEAALERLAERRRGDIFEDKTAHTARFITEDECRRIGRGEDVAMVLAEGDKRYADAVNAQPLSAQDLKRVEQYADQIFSKIGFDVQFTRHFLDRLNDARNKTQITIQELAKLFKEAFDKYGNKLKHMKPDSEAVLSDPQTFVNVPFVIEFNPRTRMMELISKTIMRKRDFKSPDPILKV